MNNIKITYLSLLLLVFFNKGNAQEIYKSNNIQINTGVSLNFGTVLNRIGFFIGGYYLKDQVQLNFQFRPSYNLSSWGTLKSTPELKISFGLLYGFGKSDTVFNKFISQVGNQTNKKNSIAYSYNIYIDKIATSQRTGTFAFEFYRVGLIHENDIFGENRSDKYRTAGILLYYRSDNFIYASNIILWHGDTFDKNAIKVLDSDYPARFGYKDLSNAKYGKFSHGILSAQISYSNQSFQIVRFDIGIDSEHVRNISQNKIVHNKRYLPNKFVGYKLQHYPMLDTDGMPYLYKKEQKIKPTKFYINFARNTNPFY